MKQRMDNLKNEHIKTGALFNTSAHQTEGGLAERDRKKGRKEDWLPKLP